MPGLPLSCHKPGKLAQRVTGVFLEANSTP